MQTITLVVFMVINGNMQTLRIKQPDLESCRAAAVQIAPALKAVHAECKVRDKSSKTPSKASNVPQAGVVAPPSV